MKLQYLSTEELKKLLCASSRRHNSTMRTNYILSILMERYEKE